MGRWVDLAPYPAMTESFRTVAELLRRLGERYQIEIQGFDQDVDGTVKVDVRIRISEEEFRTPASFLTPALPVPKDARLSRAG